MNTFTAKNEKETQSSYHHLFERRRTRLRRLLLLRRILLLTVGGLAAVWILARCRQSRRRSAAPIHGRKPIRANAIDDSLVRRVLPQDVLSLLPFEPKSWRGAQFILFTCVYRFVVIFLARSNFLSRNLRVRNRPKKLLDNKIRRVADIFSTLYCYTITFQIIISKQQHQ